jgi:GT2 family glycosyltransferase
VDNGSSDGTVRALSGQPGVRVIAAGRNLGAAGRTLGAEQAESRYIAFADDDSWWAPGALRTAGALFDAHPRLGLLVARTLVGPTEDEDPLNAPLAAAPLGHEADLPGPTVLGFLACAAVVRRHAFLQAGGFHPRFGVGGEEQLLALDLLSAGWGLAYVPTVVAHHHPADGGQRAGRRARMLRNTLWTTWLRRRLPAAARATGAAARAATHDAAIRRGLLEAAAGLPWVLTSRRTLPVEVERMARRLERAP